MKENAKTLLEIKGLHTYIYSRNNKVKAVDGVNLKIYAGEALGLVGESGSGKSMTCQSIMQIHPRPAAVIEAGEILLNSENLLTKTPAQMQKIRGAQIGMILQDPLNSLNPVFTIGAQIIESLRLSGHGDSNAELRRQAVIALRKIGIPRAEERLNSYPFEFSGGMRQRVCAAIAMVRQPQLLIADEPTTALDVTTQNQFLSLLDDLRREYDMSLLLVTHDLGVVAETCDRVAVMYCGRVVETGTIEQVFKHPKHPYTQALLAAEPQLHGPAVKRLYQINGEPPNMRTSIQGCHFGPRCAKADALCHKAYPPTVRFNNGDDVACWRHVPPALRAEQS